MVVSSASARLGSRLMSGRVSPRSHLLTALKGDVQALPQLGLGQLPAFAKLVDVGPHLDGIWFHCRSLLIVNTVPKR